MPQRADENDDFDSPWKEALQILTRLTEFSRTRYVSPYSFALVYIGLEDREKAFEWLQKSVTERSNLSLR